MKTKKLDKSLLKSGYYWEAKSWYDSLPDKVSVNGKFQTKIFDKAMSHQEILDTYKIVPYQSYQEAAEIVLSIIPKLKNDYNSRIVYFKENEILYRFDAWRYGDGQLDVIVYKVGLDSEDDAEDGVCFSNSHSDSSLAPSTLESSDPLSLEKAIEICKQNGLKVIKEL